MCHGNIRRWYLSSGGPVKEALVLRRVLVLVVIATGLVTLAAPSSAHTPRMFATGSVQSEDPGQHEDRVEAFAEVTNFRSYGFRVRCKLIVTSRWYPDADNDGL